MKELNSETRDPQKTRAGERKDLQLFLSELGVLA
jgi:hypothetical protein